MCLCVFAGSALRSFSTRTAEARVDYQRQAANRKYKLEKNRDEQEKLRRRLAELEEERSSLEHEEMKGEDEEREAREAAAVAVGQVDGWQAKIKDLQQRVDTSLQIMRDMTCV